MNVKRVMSLLLTLVMMVGLLAGCAGETGTTSANATYKITVLAPDGTPAKDVTVRILQDGKPVGGLLVPDAGGLVSKELPRGEYTLKVESTVAEVKYSTGDQDLRLTDTKTELTVELMYTEGEAHRMIYNEFKAPFLNVGKTVVELETGRNLFIFAAAEAGVYEISYNNDATAFGYYGNIFVVQDHNIGEVVEGKQNTILLEVAPGSVATEEGTTDHVLGVTVDGNATGILEIKRVADYVPDINWTNYQARCEIKAYKMPENYTVHEFDMNEEYNIVLNTEDGYYHLNTADGPLVMFRMGANSDKDCRYALSSFETVAAADHIVATYPIGDGRYDGISFGAVVLEYLKVDDEETGLYPLNEDIKYILQEVGTSKGWWDYESPNYLFYDKLNGDNKIMVNAQTAWLFNCCYITVE